MLRLMFDSHPDVAIPGESHFIIPKYRSSRREIRRGQLDIPKLISQIVNTRHFQRWNLSADSVYEGLAAGDIFDFSAAIALLYEMYAAQHGKSRWGDKTPIYVKSLDLLADLFPSARFIHIIRDGRDVALSYLDVPWGPTSIWEVARKWKIEVAGGRTSGGRLGSNRYTEVRYENLVREPEAELRRLCEFVRLPFTPMMLDFHLSASERIGHGEHDDFHRSETRAVNGPARDWATQMSDGNVLAFETISGALLKELGYPLRHQAIPLRLRTTGRMKQIQLGTRVVASQIKRSFRSRQFRHASNGQQ